jgi:hypothetical protein
MELIPPTDDGGSLVDGKGDSQVILYSSIGIGGAVILLLGIILFLRKGSPGPESEMMNAPVQEPTLTDPPAGADERSAQQLAYEKELVDPD